MGIMNGVYNVLKLGHFILENLMEDINLNSRLLTLSLQEKFPKAPIDSI